MSLIRRASEALNEAVNVRISTTDEALAVKFGLPPIPPEVILPLALAGGGLLLLTLFSFLAAMASCKAAKQAKSITEIYHKQMTEGNQEQ